MSGYDLLKKFGGNRVGESDYLVSRRVFEMLLYISTYMVEKTGNWGEKFHKKGVKNRSLQN